MDPARSVSRYLPVQHIQSASARLSPLQLWKFVCEWDETETFASSIDSKLCGSLKSNVGIYRRLLFFSTFFSLLISCAIPLAPLPLRPLSVTSMHVHVHSSLYCWHAWLNYATLILRSPTPIPSSQQYISVYVIPFVCAHNVVLLPHGQHFFVHSTRFFYEFY